MSCYSAQQRWTTPSCWRAYEQHDTFSAPADHAQGRGTTQHTTPAAPTTGPTQAVLAATTAAKPTANIKRLSPAEIVQRRKDNQRFHCDDFFTNDHKLVCKPLFTIEVLEGDRAPPVDDANPTISIHALTGMQLHVDVMSTAPASALLDSDLTHNFVDLDAAARASIKLGGRSGIQVIVANGDHVHSPGFYRNMSIVIGNEGFVFDCYDLTLGSYEMVLGVQWLESLDHMIWDFTSSLLSFVRDDHQICWAVTDAMTAAPILLAADTNIMEDLLLCYEDLFATPVSLPSQRSR
jgi:hypothetical protein